MKHIAMTLLAGAVGFGIVGCGDDDDGGSGVSGSKPVTEITDAEAQKLCRYLEQQFSFEPSKQQVCTTTAAYSSSDSESCEAFRDACLEQDLPPDETDEEDGCETAEAPALPEGCGELTVGEYESCLRAEADAFRAAFDVSCADAGNVDEGPEVLPECEGVFEKCPALAEFDTE